MVIDKNDWLNDTVDEKRYSDLYNNFLQTKTPKMTEEDCKKYILEEDVPKFEAERMIIAIKSIRSTFSNEEDAIMAYPYERIFKWRYFYEN